MNDLLLALFIFAMGMGATGLIWAGWFELVHHCDREPVTNVPYRSGSFAEGDSVTIHDIRVGVLPEVADSLVTGKLSVQALAPPPVPCRLCHDEPRTPTATDGLCMTCREERARDEEAYREGLRHA